MSFDLAVARIGEIRTHIATINNQAQTAPQTQRANMPMGGPIPTTPGAGGQTGPGTANFGDLLTKEINRTLGATYPGQTTQVNQTQGTGQGTAVEDLGQTGNTVGDRVVAEAKTWLGVPYKWGGNTRAGVDCSGLTKNVFAKHGVNLHRVARQQMTQGTEVASLDQARPGDLVVFKNGKHIGIYAGNGQMIDAPRPGKNVQLRNVYETPTTIRRVL